MKKILSLVIIATALIACNSSSKKTNSETKETVKVETVSVDKLLAQADDLVEKTIQVKGHVTHTCKHSGKRCFLVGDNEQFTIRIEAGGKITGFNRDLVGNTILVDGILKERRLSKEYIDQMEHEVNEKAKEDGTAETCATEMNNINDMRAWMKSNNKDHYSIYFVEGLSYEVVE
jgi:heat shock protein HslJ